MRRAGYPVQPCELILRVSRMCDGNEILTAVLLLRCVARLLAERPGDLSRRRHRSIGIPRFGLLLRNGPAPGLVCRLPPLEVGDRCVTDIAGRVLGRRRTGINRRVSGALLALLCGGFAVADARFALCVAN